MELLRIYSVFLNKFLLSIIFVWNLKIILIFFMFYLSLIPASKDFFMENLAPLVFYSLTLDLSLQ